MQFSQDIKYSESDDSDNFNNSDSDDSGDSDSFDSSDSFSGDYLIDSIETISTVFQLEEISLILRCFQQAF